MRYLTMIKDVDGLPRAWGAADSEEASKEAAERQWAKRVAERTANGTLDRSEERGETTTEPLVDTKDAEDEALREASIAAVMGRVQA